MDVPALAAANVRRKVAVIAPNWLGDAVMSLPLVGVLGAAEGVGVAVVASPGTARVYAGVAGVDELVVDPHCGRMKRIHTRARALFALGADACVVLPPSFSSALPPWLARVGVRVGFESDARSGLFTDALVLPSRGSEHLSESYASLGRRVLGRAGRPAAPDPAPPALRVFESDRRAAGRLCGELGVGDAPYAAVSPGATYGLAKSWMASRFRETSKAISKEIPVVLLGGPAERGLCATVAEGIPGVYNAAGRTTLGTFFALLSRARVLVANDSGAPHAAAAIGVPVVVLFGSTSPEWTRPLGGEVTVIRHPVHCAPCFRRTCPTELECFAGISTGEVVAAVQAFLGAQKKEVARAHHGR
jgi:heptosyltransferase-2